jgi:hypothetical protein
MLLLVPALFPLTVCMLGPSVLPLCIADRDSPGPSAMVSGQQVISLGFHAAAVVL